MKPNQFKYPEAGTVFGRLTFLEFAGRWNKTTYWKFKCACGTEKVIGSKGVVDGHVKSCGCLQREVASVNGVKMGKSNATHGLSRTPTWVSWSMMMMRCFNLKRIQYQDWGGRGIKPCSFIKESPANLIKIIGERPSKKLQLDRVLNNGGYWCGTCPECLENKWPLNVRWADQITQQRNKRSIVKVTYEGQEYLRQDLAAKLGKTYGWVRHHYG